MKTHLLLLLLLVTICSSCWDKKKPAPTPNPEETKPQPEEKPEPRESTGATAIAEVDSYYRMKELSKTRSSGKAANVDFCADTISKDSSFAETIEFFVDELSEGMVVQIQGIARYYGMSSNTAGYLKVGLLTHRLCPVTRASLSKTIRNIPNSATIALANKFATEHNNLFDGGKKMELKALWGRFFGCLAYTESLSTADKADSFRVAKRYGPSGYSKPPGVKFYIDPRQSQASKLNIGLFQFTPTYTGNINPCIKQWNLKYPTCKITDRSQGHMTRLVGSALQQFNAFCGVHKLAQTFSVQVHSSKNKNTHPNNYGKPSEARCVTPHFFAGWAYNHFGPLQNSVNQNLGKLMRCVYPGN